MDISTGRLIILEDRDIRRIGHNGVCNCVCNDGKQ